MHKLRLNEQQYEKIVSGVVAAKTAFFFGEGLWEAWEEGLNLTTLIRGLSYSFTWSYISPEESSRVSWLRRMSSSLPDADSEADPKKPLDASLLISLDDVRHAASMARSNKEGTPAAAQSTTSILESVQMRSRASHVPWSCQLQRSMRALSSSDRPLAYARRWTCRRWRA